MSIASYAGLTEERKAELFDACCRNCAMGRHPYENVKVYTREELLWIMHEHDWSNEFDVSGTHCINLSGAILEGLSIVNINLSGAVLNQVNLCEAVLDGVNLSNAFLLNADLRGAQLFRTNLAGAMLSFADFRLATLQRADLSGVLLEKANLSGAILDEVNFTNARLSRVNLTGARLEGAFLHGANLSRANLSGANLRDVRLDMGTKLRKCTIDEQTMLGDVTWNGAPLTQLDLDKVSKLGDERLIKEATGRKERIVAYRNAARAYRGLAIALQEQSLFITASKYRLREQRLEQKALFLEGKLGAWFFSFLLDLVAGYGERPGRAFVAYLVTVLSFTGIYYAITHNLETQLSKLSWDEALVLSLTSFHGRGFFPGFLALGDWVARFAALEAIIGLFIELILIATFSRRFLGK